MSLKKRIMAVSAAALIASAAFAQSSVYDPNQLPAFNGRIQQFVLNPHGDIDGIILSDGMEVKTPPHLSTQIAGTFRTGDAITIRGLKAAALPLVEATSVKNDATGVTVIDYGPPPKGKKGHKGAFRRFFDRETGQMPEISGKVRMTLHGPRGDVNGALLEDGTIVRMPPPEAQRLSSVLIVGQNIRVQGDVIPTVLGKVVEASAVGPAGGAVTQIAPPPPPPPGGPADAPPPPPPGAPEAPPPPR